MKTSTVGMMSFICAIVGLLLLLLQCLCWFLFEREALVFAFILLWYPALFVCGLALILGIVDIAIIKFKKGGKRDARLMIRGICLALLCFLGLCVLLVKTIPIMHIEQCGHNLRNLDEAMCAYAHDNNGELPPASKWCDVLHDMYGSHLDQFMCPDDNIGPCSYAMNENAVNLKWGMHEKMVLLFESKPGWNQVGGPALLNKTNHNAQGCFILFTDGRAEFVPTSRLGQLRWSAKESKKNKSAKESEVAE